MNDKLEDKVGKEDEAAVGPASPDAAENERIDNENHAPGGVNEAEGSRDAGDSKAAGTDREQESPEGKPENSDREQAEGKPENSDSEQSEERPENLDSVQPEERPENSDGEQSEERPENLDKEQDEVQIRNSDEKQSEEQPEYLDVDQGDEQPEKSAEDLKEQKPGGAKLPEAELEFVSGDDVPVRKKKRWKLAVGIVFIVLLLAAGGAYGAGIYYFQDKFLPNTTINGIDASYALPEDIENQIAAGVKKYKIQVESRGGKKETLTSDQIGYHYVSKGEVEGFKESQNLYKWPFSFWDDFNYTFESSTAYEEEAFNQAVENLVCLQPENMEEPRDAYMEFDTKDSEYVIVPEEQGAKLDTDKVKQVIGEAVTKSEDSISLEKKECYLKPAVTSGDKSLNRLVTKLNKYCHTRIEYVFGENREVLDGATINSWVSYDDKGNVTLDEEQIPIFVQGLAEKYDTYDKPRQFKTNDGSYVTVSGGSYGWMIDQEMEVQELTALIQSGAQTERYAAFAQTALSWENSDLGWDYIEIDLTKQHIWMYIGGEVAVESDFVSGDIRSGDKATPEGTYTLYYKKSPDVLKSDKPGDSYQTPVTFWMPFNGGVGMHDATWRGSFGGSIYTYDGSHGCINLPYDAASQIYNLIYDGFPIICFYR